MLRSLPYTFPLTIERFSEFIEGKVIHNPYPIVIEHPQLIGL
jgi:hypothetical protein